MQELISNNISDEKALAILKQGGENFAEFAILCGALWNAIDLKNTDTRNYLNENHGAVWTDGALMVDAVFMIASEHKHVSERVFRVSDQAPEIVKQFYSSVNARDFEAYKKIRSSVIEALPFADDSAESRALNKFFL